MVTFSSLTGGASYAALTRSPTTVRPPALDRSASAGRITDAATRLRDLDALLGGAIRAADERVVSRRPPVSLTGRRVTLAPASPFVPGTPMIPGSPAIPGTTATLGSTAEINPTTTSYSPFTASWAGASLSTAELTGVYTGTGDQTWTFNVTAVPDEFGDGTYELSVLDQDSNSVASISMAPESLAAGTFALPDGMTVTFGAGGLELGDSFSIDLTDATPTTFRSDQPFNGTGETRPNFPAGTTISAGSFTVNGTTISVAADDTLDDVLARINASPAGVTARFDAASDRVVFDSSTVGASNHIDLAADTSGLLAALHLTGAVLTPGTDAVAAVPDIPGTPDIPAVTAEFTRAVGDIAAFASAHNGSIRVNGVSVAVDVLHDTISDLVARITAETDATATFDQATGTLRLVSDDWRTGLDLSDSTGLLDTFGIATGTTVATVGPRRLSDRAAESIGNVVEEITSALHTVADESDGYSSPAITGLRAGYTSLVTRFSGQGYSGILDRIALTPSKSPSMLASIDANTVRRQLMRETPEQVGALMVGQRNDTNDGFLERLHGLLTSSIDSLEAEADRLRLSA